MSRKLRIRNWAEYQHYKDRCPPWIKLHFQLLSSKDWVMLSDASRVLAIACMLIASREGRDGVFEFDTEYFKRVAYLNSRPNIEPLIKSGFLEPLLADASTCKQKKADACTETETETETEYSTDHQKASLLDDRFDRFWDTYPRKIGKGAARKVWKKLKPSRELTEKILAAIIQQKNSEQWKKDNGQFIPHPATWLNQGRWEDVVETEKQKWVPRAIREANHD